MKKTLLAFVALALIATAVHAQSLVENSYYQKSLELQSMAAAAFDEGDYDAATEYANQAQENAVLSDEYVARMLAMKSANDAIAEAQARYDWATGVNAAVRFPDDYAGATTELQAARDSYTAEQFDDAVTHAYAVDAYLSGVTERETLPAYFVVRNIPSRPDCLWRIAELPFVYNDPYQWPKLYKANRETFPEPNNPDLILPGMTLTIPAIRGELRDGVWTEGREYPTMGK